MQFLIWFSEDENIFLFYIKLIKKKRLYKYIDIILYLFIAPTYKHLRRTLEFLFLNCKKFCIHATCYDGHLMGLEGVPMRHWRTGFRRLPQKNRPPSPPGSSDAHTSHVIGGSYICSHVRFAVRACECAVYVCALICLRVREHVCARTECPRREMCVRRTNRDIFPSAPPSISLRLSSSASPRAGRASENRLLPIKSPSPPCAYVYNINNNNNNNNNRIECTSRCKNNVSFYAMHLRYTG